MFIRSMPATVLALSFLALPVVAGLPAWGLDRDIGKAPKTDACGRAAPATCLVVPPIGRLMSDHGADVGETFDLQGNAVDRLHNIVAVPGSRDRAREVFAVSPF